MNTIIKAHTNLNITGIYPDYEITDHHCSCNFIKSNKATEKIDEEVIKVLKQILAKESIKSIDFGFFWNEETYREKSKIDFDNFKILNKNFDLKENIQYHIYKLKYY